MENLNFNKRRKEKIKFMKGGAGTQVSDGLIPATAATLMTKKEKIALMEDRLVKMDGRGDKNIKSPGAKKKLERQLRNLKNNNNE